MSYRSIHHEILSCRLRQAGVLFNHMGKSTRPRLPLIKEPIPPQIALEPIFLVAAILAIVLASMSYLRPHLYFVFTADVYLPIHYFAEIASVVVSFLVFAVYWNATKEIRNTRELLIGTAFLAVATIDAMHTLSFPGMPDFVTPSSVEKGIYYWLAARIWSAIVLLASAFVAPQTGSPFLRRGPLLALNLAFIALVFVTVSFFAAYLPRMFVAGHGLTPLKIALEYLVAALSVFGALLYTRAYRATGDQFYQLLSMALIVTTFSELSFTLYDAAYDIYNLLGHIYKVAAYYLIFDALLASAIRQPHAELQAAFYELDVKNRELGKLNDAIENHLKRTISELGRTAQVAGQRAAQLDAIIDNLTEGVIIADAKGVLLRYNPAALAVEGFRSQREIPPRIAELRMLRLFYPDDRPIPTEEWPISRAIRGDRFVNYEVRLVGNDRIERTLVYSGAPVRDDEGRIVLAVTVSRDITEERELSRLKDELLLIISHHLKTPLTSVKGFAQLLARRLASAAQHDEEIRGLQVIEHQVDNMHQLIERLLDVSRIQAQRFELHKERLDLAELSRDVVQKLQPISEDHVLQLSMDGATLVYADRRRIEEALSNLVSNAINHSRGGTSVDITVERRNGEALAMVRDYGVGIPKEKQRFIFQQFYRATPTPYSDGMGLGLYITRGIVEAHGGRIWFESPPNGPDNEPQKGSAFYFSLPLIEDIYPSG